MKLSIKYTHYTIKWDYKSKTIIPINDLKSIINSYEAFCNCKTKTKNSNTNIHIIFELTHNIILHKRIEKSLKSKNIFSYLKFINESIKDFKRPHTITPNLRSGRYSYNDLIDNYSEEKILEKSMYIAHKRLCLFDVSIVE